MSSSPLLLLHICGGGIGLLSGAVAMSFRKGSRWHGMAGDVFVISMMTMSGAGAYMALMRSEMSNVFGGLSHLLHGGHGMGDSQTPRRGNGHLRLGWAAGGTGARNRHGDLWDRSGNQPDGHQSRHARGNVLVFGSLARLQRRGTFACSARRYFGIQRIARHLWRMCFAWFAATASLFLARPHLFPAGSAERTCSRCWVSCQRY